MVGRFRGELMERLDRMIAILRSSTCRLSHLLDYGTDPLLPGFNRPIHDRLGLSLGEPGSLQRRLKTSIAVLPRIFWASSTLVASNTAWMALRV